MIPITYRPQSSTTFMQLFISISISRKVLKVVRRAQKLRILWWRQGNVSIFSGANLEPPVLVSIVCSRKETMPSSSISCFCARKCWSRNFRLTGNATLIKRICNSRSPSEMIQASWPHHHPARCCVAHITYLFLLCSTYRVINQPLYVLIRVPNSGRIYYLNRSQTPYSSLCVSVLCRQRMYQWLLCSYVAKPPEILIFWKGRYPLQVAETHRRNVSDTLYWAHYSCSRWSQWYISIRTFNITSSLRQCYPCCRALCWSTVQRNPRSVAVLWILACSTAFIDLSLALIYLVTSVHSAGPEYCYKFDSCRTNEPVHWVGFWGKGLRCNASKHEH